MKAQLIVVGSVIASWFWSPTLGAATVTTTVGSQYLRGATDDDDNATTATTTTTFTRRRLAQPFCTWQANCLGGPEGGDWCNESEERCKQGCQAPRWCSAGGTPTPPTPPPPAPTPPPTPPPAPVPPPPGPSPVTPQPVSATPTVSPMVAPSPDMGGPGYCLWSRDSDTTWCDESEANCATCGGDYCLGGPAPGPAPPQPTPSPVVTPTHNENQMPTTPSPVMMPVSSPTILPTGPFIAAGYSERIVIPQPPMPPASEMSMTNCPHDDDSAEFVDFHSLELTSSNGDVSLPTNTKVVMQSSQHVTLSGILTIPSTSQLLLAPSSAQGIQLTLPGMIVNGALVAGSETCRLEWPVNLTFTGSRPDDVVTNVPPPSVKGIDVDGGTISLHGKRFYRTWTRLAETVQPGEDILMLQDAVNWQVGQTIVLVTTAMKDSREWHQNEVLTIAEVFPTSPTGAAIRTSSPVTHRHVATPGYQAEVGLLSRTITIQGSALDSEHNDPDPLNCNIGSALAYRWYNDGSQPCLDRELTGYGAHVIVQNGGIGQIEGVEFFRAGQTNVLGRYPMHFHLLGDCPTCYIKDSSIHRSFYRCVSVHATNQAMVSENVAYDVTGYCYYLEDGVETNNDLLYNLAAHIHLMGPSIPTGDGQTTEIYTKSSTLTLPADVTASGFYITNIHNNIIGNSASGGWSAFAFPNLPTPVGLSRDIHVRPSAALPLTIDGNTGHSTGWWWYHAGAFYFGGSLYFDDNGVLSYNAGRALGDRFYVEGRDACLQDFCANGGDCFGICLYKDRLWVRVTNSKAYLTAGVGLNSWTGRMEIIGFESHDNGLASESLDDHGFWIDDMLVVCRTGEHLVVSRSGSLNRIPATGFFWYDTNQAHIITNSLFRQCGYRSNQFNQYDNSPTRGCDDNPSTGCHQDSTVFGFLAHSDQFNPEIMQGTRNITYDNVGRRFWLRNFAGDFSTVSGRIQNWFDVDGSASGLNTPTIIGSGQPECGLWWKAGVETIHDDQGPLEFIPQFQERGLAHIRVTWDASVHNQVGNTVCGNGGGQQCNALGYIKHRGPRFAIDNGLPVTANPDIVGLSGGYGWYLEWNEGIVPREITINTVEVDNMGGPLLLSVAYPPGTTVTTTFEPFNCTEYDNFRCDVVFDSVDTVDAVRASPGNVYHMSPGGVLTIRIIMSPQTFSGQPDWLLADFETIGKNGNVALDSFERDGILIPISHSGNELVNTYLNKLVLRADCAGSTYCNERIDRSVVAAEISSVCPPGMTNQLSFDRCCNSSYCVYPNGFMEDLF